jgi:hypothetical protein
VGGFPKLYYTFTSATIIPIGGYISIFFPYKTAFTNSSISSLTCASNTGNASCVFSTNVSDSSQVTAVNWTTPCYKSGKCNGSTAFILTTTGFINAPTNASNANTTYTIRTYNSQGYLVDNGTANITYPSLYPNALSVSLASPTTITVGETTSYTI